jgi:hypothetical protein
LKFLYSKKALTIATRKKSMLTLSRISDNSLSVKINNIEPNKNKRSPPWKRSFAPEPLIEVDIISRNNNQYNMGAASKSKPTIKATAFIPKTSNKTNPSNIITVFLAPVRIFVAM